jgi:hypothetical protein
MPPGRNVRLPPSRARRRRDESWRETALVRSALNARSSAALQDPSTRLLGFLHPSRSRKTTPPPPPAGAPLSLRPGMSHLFPNQGGYGGQSQGYTTSAYPHAQQAPDLAFFGSSVGGAGSSGAYGGYGGGEAVSGSMGSMGGGGIASGRLQGEGRWWEAFGTSGFEGEPPLLEGASLNLSQASRAENRGADRGAMLCRRARHQLLAHCRKVAHRPQPAVQARRAHHGRRRPRRTRPLLLLLRHGPALRASSSSRFSCSDKRRRAAVLSAFKRVAE